MSSYITGAPGTETQKREREVAFEKGLLVLLFVITISQFGIWGYDSVLHILGMLFDVETPSTFLSVVIGFSAMIASGIVFSGAWMWWKRNFRAFSLITYGSVVFMIKNVFDLIDKVLIFGKTHTDVTLSQIQMLAAQLGNEFFQLAFWVFIFFYFRNKIRGEYERLNSPRESAPLTDQTPPVSEQVPPAA